MSISFKFQSRRMMEFYVLCIISLIFLLTTKGICAQEREIEHVQLLRIIGSKEIPKKKIKQQISDLAPPIFFKFWKNGAEFSEKKLQDGIKKIIRFYKENGFYRTRIKPNVIKKANQVKIILNIEEGQPVLIKNITFAIKNDKDQDWEFSFLKMIPIHEGDILRVVLYEKAKTKILEYLSNSGYPLATLMGNVIVYEEENQADIHFTVDHGSLTHFGKLKIQGNEKVPLKIIRGEITFFEGEIFSMKKIFHSQTQIFRLNLFRSVLVEPVNLSEKTESVDILVSLKERKPYTLETGVGYGTEDKMRFRIDSIYRHFWKGANELRFTLRYSSLTEEEALIFTHPYFLFPASTLTNTISRKKDIFLSFETSVISFENKIEKRMSPQLSFFVGHKLDTNKIKGLSRVTQEELNHLQEEEYFLSYLQTGLTYNTIDSPLNPTNGFTTSFFFEPSHEVIASEISYIKETLEFKYYWQPVTGPVYAFRIFFGNISPIGLNQKAIPLFKRFFSGGTSSVRGYAYQKLGPLDTSGDPIGGNSIIEGSCELRIPLVGKLWGVLFLDFGNIFLDTLDRQWNSLDWDNLRYAAGTGLRYNTIIGPIRLDYGYILNPEKIDTRKDEARYQIYFSIGHAF